MTADDRRPQHVARDLGRAHAALDDILDALAGLQALDPIDRPPRHAPPGRRTGISDPTGARLVAYESGLDWHLRHLVGWIEVRHPAGIEVLQPGVIHQVEDLTASLGGTTTLAALAAQVRATGVATRDGKQHLRRLGTATHGALAEIHDGWHALHQARWVPTDGGHVLDEDADRDCWFTASSVSTVSRDLGRVARRLCPPAPTQPRLVFCKNHDDELAKYPGRKLCAACYERERRRSSRGR
jgi:hypothetical protein